MDVMKAYLRIVRTFFRDIVTIVSGGSPGGEDRKDRPGSK